MRSAVRVENLLRQRCARARHANDEHRRRVTISGFLAPMQPHAIQNLDGGVDEGAEGFGVVGLKALKPPVARDPEAERPRRLALAPPELRQRELRGDRVIRFDPVDCRFNRAL
jgi:hypothetical protein